MVESGYELMYMDESGLSETVFGIYGDDGYTWRYVPNTRIEFLKLEKIVDPELHRDTQQEKAQK